MSEMPPVFDGNCPGCGEPPIGLVQVGGGHTFPIGEDADVLCFGCGETYVITLTVFGWVARAATGEERETAARDPRFNKVRADYIDYRERHPEVWDE